jgi:hypothetical protein
MAGTVKRNAVHTKAYAEQEPAHEEPKYSVTVSGLLELQDAEGVYRQKPYEETFLLPEKALELGPVSLFITDYGPTVLKKKNPTFRRIVTHELMKVRKLDAAQEIPSNVDLMSNEDVLVFVSRNKLPINLQKLEKVEHVREAVRRWLVDPNDCTAYLKTVELSVDRVAAKASIFSLNAPKEAKGLAEKAAALSETDAVAPNPRDMARISTPLADLYAEGKENGGEIGVIQTGSDEDDRL